MSLKLKRGISNWKYDFQNPSHRNYFYGYSENENQGVKQYFINEILFGYELDYGDKTFYI